MHRHSLCTALLLVSLNVPASEPLQLRSARQAPVVIELFTSQGCSSCPPAERWLSRLAGEDELWTRLIPLAWHVDYWNDLGWTDVFSRPQYSQRQRDYARHGDLGQVYTPGVLRNGREWRLWRAGQPWQQPPGAEIGVLTLELDHDAGVLGFAPGPAAPTGRLTGHIALVGLGHVTAIARGENRGRRLREDFVVLDTQHADLADNRVRLPLPSATGVSAKRLAIVAWLSRAPNPAPIQAVAGWLPAGPTR